MNWVQKIRELREQRNPKMVVVYKPQGHGLTEIKTIKPTIYEKNKLARIL